MATSSPVQPTVRPAEPARWPVIGHEATVDALQSAIVTNHVRHAYLFAGPAGVGKRTLAEVFACALCCQAAPAPGLACGACRTCRKIGRGVHPDVTVFSLARQAALATKGDGKNTSLTIDTVRELSAATALRPLEGRWRVILVEDAETMQPIAQEALLKTLEEPSPYVVLLVLTDEAERLLPTIRSRCQTIELRPVAREVIADALTRSGVNPDRAREVAGLAGGRPGWAVRAVDDTRLVAERHAAWERALAWMAGSAYDRLVAAVRLADTYPKRRDAVLIELDALLSVWRDALLMGAGQTPYLTCRWSDNRLADLVRGWDLAVLARGVRSVGACISDLQANVRPRLAMETMVLQWPTTPA